jgi:hypothetical protein
VTHRHLDRDHRFDEAAGPLVRPYAVTGGRTRTTTHLELNMITLVVALRTAVGLPGLDREYQDILNICGRPLSVAEIAAKLRLPLAVTKILIVDLVESGYMIFRSPPPPSRTNTANLALLEKVLDGLRRL